jgi:sulfoxide reductase heme-binding subunit YedZ
MAEPLSAAAMRRFVKPALFLLCSLPLAWIAARAFELGGLGLGANPIDELQDRLGEWGLRLLLATLCVTPLAVSLRKPWLLGVRRMLGLFAFTYLVLHFLTWLVLDQWFDLAAIAADIAKRPYITVGFTAFLLLVPLAVTSTAGWMRRLGRRWHRLHRLVYPAAILGCAHFWWQVKADWREPAAYAAVLLVLLGWRVRRARRRSAAAAAFGTAG